MPPLDAAFTIARMPALSAAGRSGQASMIATKSAGIGSGDSGQMLPGSDDCALIPALFGSGVEFVSPCENWHLIRGNLRFRRPLLCPVELQALD